eukprot:gnl/Dysnectes_brevis/1627_a1852_2562.p1 GENE.gnl/Dysnectes_brevis/1627_a1852_2562~~gnl/Dysnectes_brevis/1627_a1852_2562.p1  ORF type:complete len:356 (-),score=97.48 gnl/Dysnectes_brevis/1627_a1852_2562:95-1018(-)
MYAEDVFKYVVGGVVIFVTLFFILFCENVRINRVGLAHSKWNGIVKQEPYEEGWHVVAPFTKIMEFSLVVNYLDFMGNEAIACRTSDGQRVVLGTKVMYRMNKEEVYDLYTLILGEHETLVTKISRNAICDVASVYSANDFLAIGEGAAGLADITAAMEDLLKARLAEVYVQLDAVPAPSMDFDQDIEDELTELASKPTELEVVYQTNNNSLVEYDYDLSISLYQANATIAEASGEAEAVQIEAEGTALRISTETEGDVAIINAMMTSLGGDYDLFKEYLLTEMATKPDTSIVVDLAGSALLDLRYE